MCLCSFVCYVIFFFFFQAEDGIRDKLVTGVQTCALPISQPAARVVLLERRSALGLRAGPSRVGDGRRGVLTSVSCPSTRTSGRGVRLRPEGSGCRESRATLSPSSRLPNSILAYRTGLNA